VVLAEVLDTVREGTSLLPVVIILINNSITTMGVEEATLLIFKKMS